MAFLFCDSFDSYGGSGSNSDLIKKGWSSTSGNFSSSAGKWGGGGFNTNSTTGLVKNGLTTPSGSAFYAACYLATGFPSGVNPFLQINNQQILSVNTAGQIILVNNNSTALATGTTVISNATSGQYHWVEFAVTLNGSSTTAQCWVDGVSQFSGTYALSAFPAAAITACTFGIGGNSVGYIDDALIWDNTGSTFNTSPLGPRRMSVLTPNAAGASTQFTPSSGSNWQCVSQAYSGSANVSDAGTGNTDLYAHANMAYTPASVINAVVMNTYVIDPSGGSTRSYAAKLRSGSSPAVASGPTRTCPATATNYQDAFFTDSSSAAWTLTTVNSCQPGVGD